MLVKKTFQRYYQYPERVVSFLFYKNGYIVASYPWLFIIGSGLLFLITTAGMFKMQMEQPEDIWYLYFPQGKPVSMGSNKLNQYFPSHSSDNYWPHQDTGGVVSLGALYLVDKKKDGLIDTLHNINESCHFLSDFVAVINKQQYKYSDVCALRQSLCVQPKMCADLQHNASYLCKKEDYSREGNFVEDKTLSQESKGLCDKSETMIVTTVAIRLNWYFKRDSIADRRLSEAWIRQAFDAFYAKKEADFTSQQVHLFSMVVQFDEYHSIVHKDSPFVGLTVILMTIFAISVSLKVPNFLQSRSVVAVAGVVTTLMAIGSTLGTLAYLGVPFIEVAFLTPFIMLGIGIDSTFLLMFTWANQQQLQSVQGFVESTSREQMVKKVSVSAEVNEPRQQALFEERAVQNGATQSNGLPHQNESAITNGCSSNNNSSVMVCIGATLRKAMISIFISSITSFTAFLIGSFTPYPAVNIACYHLAVFTLYILFYEATFFTGSLTLHHKRVVGNAIVHSAESSPNSVSKRNCFDSQGANQCNNKNNNETCVHISGSNRASGVIDHFNKLEILVKEWLPKLVLHNAVRIPATLIVVMLIIFLTKQALTMEQYFNEIEYQPDDSRILDFYTTTRALYKDPVLVSFVIDHPIDYWNSSQLDQVKTLYEDLVTQDFSDDQVNNDEAMQPWFIRYQDVLNNTNRQRQFRKTVKMWKLWLKTLPYVNDWVVNESNDISKSRFFVALKPVVATNIEHTKYILETLNKITKKYEFNVYFSSRDMMLWERSSHMRQSIWTTIVIALASCFTVTVFLLPQPVVFVSVIFCGASTMICTLGCMAVYGIEYSLCTYIIVLLMIGLCIDYISHTGYAYIVEMCEKSSESTKKALENVGVPLFNAAMSSIISISMLGFSSSTMMRRLFISMVLLFSFSFFFGVIFLPIILSVIGPTKKREPNKILTKQLPRTTPVQVNNQIGYSAGKLMPNARLHPDSANTRMNELESELPDPSLDASTGFTPDCKSLSIKDGSDDTNDESYSESRLNTSSEKETNVSFEIDSSI